MFSEIAPRYDLLNRLLSFGVDRRWRMAAVREALEDNPRRLLDVATGTGDVALLVKAVSPGTEVIGMDFSPEMIAIARQKARQTGAAGLYFVPGDAMEMQFPDEFFQALTVAFGFRNFHDYERGLAEFYRVLTPGGRAVILEFPPPPDGWFGRVYKVYFDRVLPFLGGMISKKPEAYRYLPETVERFPKPEDFRKMMEAAGFRTRYRLLSGGIAAIFVGVKDARG